MAYLQDMYRAWQADPTSVHASWDLHFRSVERAPSAAAVMLPSPVQPRAPGVTHHAAVSSDSVKAHLETNYLIQWYQNCGHLLADLDPLQIWRKQVPVPGSPDAQGFPNELISSTIDQNNVYTLPKGTFIGAGQDALPFKEIVQRLHNAYCQHIGVHFMNDTDIGIERAMWIREKFETPNIVYQMSKEEKIHLLRRLMEAVMFEAFLSRKFPSEKRFGLEGCETFIPGLKAIFDVASANGADCFHIGMAHRGRLNTLSNICHVPVEQMLAQFTEIEVEGTGSGDVKYHLGASGTRTNRVTNKPMTVTLMSNPSHLETIGPIVIGKTKAQQFYENDADGTRIWPILIHGDAAMPGQGIVYEGFNLCDLPDYSTHGCIHIAINNQIGFTTNPKISRSSEYCTDVAKFIDAPVLHVNGDDPEAVCYVMKVAAEYKIRFKKDVVIDLIGYRRKGHNETDEPMFTQPFMYKKIKARPNIQKLYSDKLIQEKLITAEEVAQMETTYNTFLDEKFESAKSITRFKLEDWSDTPWTSFFVGTDPLQQPDTSVDKDILVRIAQSFSTPPPNFEIHRGIERILKQRAEMIKSDSMDWAMGEALTFGSLLQEGTHVRLSGQDSPRGTFSHRHHVLHHQSQDKQEFNLLGQIFPNQAVYSACNSALSEYAVLGFELGYSIVNPNALVMWEGQFGDFHNTAQVIVDQFIASGEKKWGRQTGLVILLPHGLEGQGPEHSSGRMERVLQLSDDDEDTLTTNMAVQLHTCNCIVANVSTPANFFHLVRRQIKLNFRKPLVIFTPKSLLRHPKARSSFAEMSSGSKFQPYISDPDVPPSPNVKKLMICSGKVYYDIIAEREERKLTNQIAVSRLEQLSPFPYADIIKDVNQYPNCKVYWLQEEHKNQGGWDYVKQRLQTALGAKCPYIGRPPSAAPATGQKKIYKRETIAMTNDAMALD